VIITSSNSNIFRDEYEKSEGSMFKGVPRFKGAVKTDTTLDNPGVEIPLLSSSSFFFLNYVALCASGGIFLIPQQPCGQLLRTSLFAFLWLHPLWPCELFRLPWYCRLVTPLQLCEPLPLSWLCGLVLLPQLCGLL
jgi:hypothetical protein